MILFLEIVFYIPTYEQVGRLSGGVKKNVHDSDMSRSLIQGLNLEILWTWEVLGQGEDLKLLPHLSLLKV